MRQKVNQFSDEIKIQVVQAYLSGNFTQKELMLKYNIRGKQCINNWIRKFVVEQPTNKPPMSKRVKSNESDSSLDLKIKRLEEELKREQFKTKALNTMIDIAERELKINIRKKSGAKRKQSCVQVIMVQILTVCATCLAEVGRPTISVINTITRKK